METINGLLRALDNKVPASISKRLDGLQKINQKLRSARQEHESNPTEESQEALDEIVEFLNDTEEDLLEDLSVLVEQKSNAERQASQERANQEAKIRQANEAKARREQAEAKERQLAEAKARQASELRARKEASELRARREANERRAIEERRKQELEKKELEEKALGLDGKALESGGKTEPAKKSGIGWGSLILGGVALALTGGLINFFGNKR